MTLSLPPSLRIVVAAALLGCLMPLGAHAQTTPPPARTYFTDTAGRQTGVKERWGLDAGGERHGMYQRYNENGLLVESATYVHGAQTGPGVRYNNLLANFSIPGAKRPDTKFVGMYRAGKEIGTWKGYDDTTQELRVTVVFDASGNEQLVTYYKDGKPGRTINRQQQRDQATPRPVAPVKAGELYAFTATDKATFAKTIFKFGGVSTTGAQLAAGSALRSEELCDLVKENPDPNQVRMLLSASKSLGANPTKLIITNAALTMEQLRPLLIIKDVQVDAELIYYGLRGSEVEKGHGTNMIVQRIINARGGEERFYQEKLEECFNVCAKAANDMYSDTKAYPLRRWLYDEYKDTGDPGKWMNRITKPVSDWEDDKKLYPGT